jgi:hypothetical protein
MQQSRNYVYCVAMQKLEHPTHDRMCGIKIAASPLNELCNVEYGNDNRKRKIILGVLKKMPHMT